MQPRTALLVTYTMADPAAAVGVFFRALRLSHELSRRGWRCVICNNGAIPFDPKVDAAAGVAEIIRFDGTGGGDDFRRGLSLFRDIAPDVVLFGEYPIPFMEPLFLASRALVTPPIVMLEQYYSPESGQLPAGVDTLIMYGLRSLWPGAALRHPAFAVVPPFIEHVAAPRDLPIPAGWHGRPMLTILGFDAAVLRMGLDVFSRLHSTGAVAVTSSHSPDGARQLAAAAGIAADRCHTLPLQPDPILFGLLAASRAAVVANGFMQMAEALALGCPVVCIHRGIGLDGYQLDRAYEEVTAFPESADAGAARVREWLAAAASTTLRGALARERGGTAKTVDLIERTAARPRRASRLQRRAIEWRRRAMDLALPTGKASANDAA
jgi:hypothetical protein